MGQVALGLLEERRHPRTGVVALASSRSDGKTLPYSGGSLTVYEATPDSFEKIDVAFISANSAVSKALAPEAIKRGAFVIDDGSAFRMKGQVPLVVPEVNGADIEKHLGIVSIPNCIVTPLCMVLKPLMNLGTPIFVTVVTFQATTGAGVAANRRMIKESKRRVTNPNCSPFNFDLAFNVNPFIDEHAGDGYTLEESKVMMESRKVLHLPDLRVSATCVRVPVEVGHSGAVHIQFDGEVNPAEARQALANFPGVRVADEPDQGVFPTPIMAAGEREVIVGRIREDKAFRYGLALWFSCDNLLKGAALNAMQTLEEAIRRGCLEKGADYRIASGLFSG